MKIEPGFSGLLKFLNYLKGRKIQFNLAYSISDCILVSIVLIDYRLEVYFYSEYVAYSVFSGNEDMKDDFNELERMFDEFQN